MGKARIFIQAIFTCPVYSSLMGGGSNLGEHFHSVSLTQWIKEVCEELAELARDPGRGVGGSTEQKFWWSMPLVLQKPDPVLN